MFGRTAAGGLAAAILVVGGSASGQDGAAPSPAALAMARQIIDVAIPRDRREQVFGAAINAAIAQTKAAALARITDKGLRRVVIARLDAVPGKLRVIAQRNAPAIAEAIARSYAREFSPAELTAITAFARTPAGAHYLAHSTQVATDGDVVAANKAYFSAASAALAAEEKSISSDVRTYIANHPEAAPR